MNDVCYKFATKEHLCRESLPNTNDDDMVFVVRPKFIEYHFAYHSKAKFSRISFLHHEQNHGEVVFSKTKDQTDIRGYRNESYFPPKNRNTGGNESARKFCSLQKWWFVINNRGFRIWQIVYRLFLGKWKPWSIDNELAGVLKCTGLRVQRDDLLIGLFISVFENNSNT